MTVQVVTGPEVPLQRRSPGQCPRQLRRPRRQLRDRRARGTVQSQCTVQWAHLSVVHSSAFVHSSRFVYRLFWRVARVTSGLGTVWREESHRRANRWGIVSGSGAGQKQVTIQWGPPGGGYWPSREGDGLNSQGGMMSAGSVQ